MKLELTQHGMFYTFDNGCSLSVISDWAAMGDEEHPYEWMLNTPWGSTEPVGYQTQEQLDEIIALLKTDNLEKIKEVYEEYSDDPYEPPQCPHFALAVILHFEEDGPLPEYTHGIWKVGIYDEDFTKRYSDFGSYACSLHNPQDRTGALPPTEDELKEIAHQLGYNSLTISYL